MSCPAIAIHLTMRFTGFVVIDRVERSCAGMGATPRGSGDVGADDQGQTANLRRELFGDTLISEVARRHDLLRHIITAAYPSELFRFDCSGPNMLHSPP